MKISVFVCLSFMSLLYCKAGSDVFTREALFTVLTIRTGSETAHQPERLSSIPSKPTKPKPSNKHLGLPYRAAGSSLHVGGATDQRLSALRDDGGTTLQRFRHIHIFFAISSMFHHHHGKFVKIWSFHVEILFFIVFVIITQNSSKSDHFR